MRRTLPATLLIVGLWLAACGDDGAPAEPDAGRDAGPVAAADAGPGLPEAGADAGPAGCASGCGGGFFCEREPGDCDGSERCSRVPDVCPPTGTPVCGCDGETYASDCERRRAGVSKDRDGPCEGLVCEPVCADPFYCAREDGSDGCTGPGVCNLPGIPFECEAAPEEPVCGCDGVTYRNRVCAEAAPVAVDHEGPCT